MSSPYGATWSPFDILYGMENIRILDNFIDDATCNHMIEVYNRLFKDKERTPPDNRRMIRNSTDPEVISFLKIYLDKLSDTLGAKYHIRDLLLSIYEPGAYLPPHIDFVEEEYKDSLGVLFYFSGDFEGGEIYFPGIDYEYKPSKGSAFIFPCNDQVYEHGVKEVTSGIRYTMPIEITTKEHLKIYRF